MIERGIVTDSLLQKEEIKMAKKDESKKVAGKAATASNRKKLRKPTRPKQRLLQKLKKTCPGKGSNSLYSGSTTSRTGLCRRLLQ